MEGETDTIKVMQTKKHTHTHTHTPSQVYGFIKKIDVPDEMDRESVDG